jgi:hypothetical protein
VTVIADGSPADLMTAILREKLPEAGARSDAVPAALRRIVRHCLEKDPEERASAGSFGDGRSYWKNPTTSTTASVTPLWPTSAWSVSAPFDERSTIALFARVCRARKLTMPSPVGWPAVG